MNTGIDHYRIEGNMSLIERVNGLESSSFVTYTINTYYLLVSNLVLLTFITERHQTE